MRSFKLVLLSSIFLLSNYLKGQYLDSSFVAYNNQAATLSCYIKGMLSWTDINFIVDIKDSTNLDTVYVDVHFSPCQVYHTFMPYDPAFVLNRSLSAGHLWTVKFTTILDQELDTMPCRYFPHDLRVDSMFHNLFVPIGIKENSSSSLSSYPNPVNSILHLDIPEEEKIYSLTITDAFGRTFPNIRLEGNTIACSGLPNGMYFLRLQTEGTTQILKFVKSD